MGAAGASAARPFQHLPFQTEQGEESAKRRGAERPARCGGTPWTAGRRGKTGRVSRRMGNNVYPIPVKAGKEENQESVGALGKVDAVARSAAWLPRYPISGADGGQGEHGASERRPLGKRPLCPYFQVCYSA